MPQTAVHPSSSQESNTSLLSSSWNPQCHITYTRDSWVKLVQLPSAYSYDEALLLCQNPDQTWLAWVPDHGELVLNRSEFYC